MKLAAGSEFGAYHIVRHIGGGGMAQIYLAKTNGLAGFEKYLALKVINTEYANEDRFVQMLINEAKIAVGLSHVNIAQVFDLGECDGIYYIAMEYVDGLDVLELVNSLHAIGRHVPIEAVVYIGRQICSGLHYAHTRKDMHGHHLNIVHRDISPQNILVSRAGEVKVVDFGIAKAAGVSTKTQAGVIKGKVNYMAPEQLLGKKSDARTDIFSVGIVVWEMLTSQMVYAGDNVEQLAVKVRKANIAPPSSVRPEIPSQLDAVVMKALDPNPQRRFSTAHEFQVELTKYLSATAPDYSGSSLARLVEKICAKSDRDPDDSLGLAEEEKSVLSRDDWLEDQNSLIFQAEGPAELVIQRAEGEQVCPIEGDMTIGRAGDLTVQDARVSRQHARIRRVGADYIIEDLGSSNGTFVNDQRLTAPFTLIHGCRIRVGNCRLVFRLRDQTPSDPSDFGSTAADPIMPGRLLLGQGADQLEQPLANVVDLAYEVQLGPMQLTGSSARVVRKSDGYWLEPSAGCSTVTFNGEAASRPTLLAVGDRFEVNGIVFTVAN